MIRAELKYLRTHHFVAAVLVVISLIPSIYAVTFLNSMWDPYGKTSELPVAIVNNDKPATMNGTRLALGATMTTSLAKSTTLDFHEVSAATAASGLHSGKYFAIYTIPSSFSSNATTIFSEHPKQLKLHVTQSSGQNLFAGKITTSAATAMQSKINGQLTTAYTKTLVNGIEKIAAGMQKSGQGATKVAQGNEKLSEAIATLQSGEATLAQGAKTAASGSTTLATGTTAYTHAVATASDGSTTLNQNLQQAAQKTPSLVTGLTALHKGAATLSTGVAAAATGSEKLSQSAAKLSSGITTYTDATHDYAAKMTQFSSALDEFSSNLVAAQKTSGSSQLSDLAKLLTAVQSALKTISQSQKETATAASTAVDKTAMGMHLNATQRTQLTAAVSSVYSSSSAAQQKALTPLLTQLNSALATLQKTIAATGTQQKTVTAALEKLTQSSSQLLSAATTLSQKASSINDGSTQLATGATKLATSSAQLSHGAATLTDSLNTAIPQAQTLSSGVSSLAAGSSTLSSGLNTLVSKGITLNSAIGSLASGTQSISDGVVTLDTATEKIHSGATVAASGSTKLAQGLTDAAAQLPSLHFATSNTTMAASPATVSTKDTDTVPNNGTAMAPYMGAVALFVCAMAVNLMFDTETPRGRFHQASAASRSGRRRTLLGDGASLWLSKTIVVDGVALLAATFEYCGLRVLGLTPANGVATWLVLTLTSLTFMNLVTWLNLTFGKVGSFFAMVLLVLQLGSSGGTYPIQLSNGFFAWLHPLLPMSYTVEALRHTIMMSTPWTSNISILCGFFAAFSLLMFLGYERRAWKKTRNTTTETILTPSVVLPA
ncbi:MAG: YhgE/Pip domain-containing protein [Bifidobacteriaceae bacterium]|nr:YhgE/Pip domain-containing protein [Bifidobacteriaceae bacterium]